MRGRGITWRRQKANGQPATFATINTGNVSHELPVEDLRDLLPEGGFAGGKKSVLARIPAEEMGGTRVRGVVLAACPDFVEEICARVIGGAVQIVLQATLFLARGADESAEFGFEEHVLAFLGTERDDESDAAFGEFDDFGATGAAAGARRGALPCFSLGHDGGDCTPTGMKSNGDLWSIPIAPF